MSGSYERKIDNLIYVTKKTGQHSFEDDCPPTVNLNKLRDSIKVASMYFSQRIPILNRLGTITRLGPLGLLATFDGIVAQRRLREYMKINGSQQEAMSEFYAPNVFDANKFNTDTIIRFTPDIQARCSLYNNDETMLPRNCHRHQVYSEYPRGWVETKIPIPPKIPSSYLGVIRKLPAYKDHVIMLFENDQLKLMSKNVHPSVNKEPITLGEELHFSLRGQWFGKFGVRLDLIASAAKIEILAIGKGSKRLKNPPERSLASAKAWGYSPI